MVAPVDVNEIFPLGEPVAPAVNRTYTVVDATDPLVCVRVSVDAYQEEELVDTSKPVGAVMVMLLVRLQPCTVKF